MKITLALLAKPKVGGWATFTAHLYHGLVRAGHEVQLVKLGNRIENKKRPFGRGLEYRNVDRLGLNYLANNSKLIVTALDKHHVEYFPERAAALVIHDPTEITKHTTNIINNIPIITIRTTVSRLLQQKNILNHYIPHPYAQSGLEKKHPTIHAIAFSRVDWDKGTHFIVEANLQLKEEHKIHIHGFCNTIYAHQKLTPIDPSWRENYYGAWSPNSSLWHGTMLARSAKYAIDLSAISQDGGGTQYSFLEALDSGTPLIIHKNWLTGNPELDSIEPYIHAAVTNQHELIQAIQEKPKTINPAPILEAHDATRIADLLIKYLNK